MPTLRIHRTHSLELKELQARVDQLAQKLVASYGGDYRWQGDRVRYRRSGGVDAEIHCGEEQLHIEVILGPLAGFLGGAIERELNEVLDRYLQSS